MYKMGIRNWLFWGRWRGKKPLSDDEFNEQGKAIRQKASIRMTSAERSSAVDIDKDEREIRRSLRQFGRDYKKIANILGKMQQAAARGKTEEFKRKLKYWNGQVYKIENYKVRAGGYAGLIAQILSDLVNVTNRSKDKKKLLAISNSILSKFKTLEDRISKITNNVRLIQKSTSLDDKLWTALGVAVKDASQLWFEINRHAQNGLALEVEIRKALEKA